MRSANARLRLADAPPAVARRRQDPTLWVGVLLIVALAGGLGLLFTMTDAALFRDRYIVTSRVPDAAGIRKGDPVQVRGVNVGRILGFQLDPEGVTLRLEIEGEYSLPADSRVQLRPGGLLGGTVAEILPGTSSRTLAYGDQVTGISEETLSAATERLADGAGAVLGRAAALLSDTAIEDVQAGAAQIRGLLSSLSGAVAEQRGELAALTRSLRQSAEGLEQATTGPALARAIGELDRVAERAAAMAVSLDRSSRSLEVILGRIERGEGTLGRLANDDALYEEVRAAVGSIQAAGDEVTSLVTAIKKDPRRYVKISVF